MIVLNRKDGDNVWICIPVQQKHQAPSIVDSNRFLINAVACEFFVVETFPISKVSLVSRRPNELQLSTRRNDNVWRKPSFVGLVCLDQSETVVRETNLHGKLVVLAPGI